MEKKAQNNLAKNSISIFSMQTLSLALTALTTVVLGRVLGPAGKGAFSLIILIPWIMVETGHLGMGAAIVYFIGRRKHELKNIVNNIWVFDLLWGSTIVVAVLLVLPYLSPIFFRGINLLYMILPLVVLPLWLVSQHFAWVMLAKDYITKYNILMIARPLVFLVLLPSSLLLLRGHLAGAVLSWVIAIIIATLLSIIYLAKFVALRFSFNLSLIKSMLSYGLKAYVGTLLLFLNYRFDLLLVSMFLNITQVGLYSVALALAEVIWRIPNSIGLALFPKVSSSDLKESNLLTPVVSRNTIFIAALACVPFVILGRPMITLVFGLKFVPLLSALWFLLPGVVVFSAGRILVSYFNGSGRPMVTGFSSLVSLILMVVLDVLFIPRWGLAGAALASTIAYTVFSLIMLYFFVRSAHVSFRELLFLRFSDLKAYGALGLKSLNGGKSFLRRYLNGLEPD